MIPKAKILRPRYRRRDVERLIWKPQLWKMKSAFWEFGQERMQHDPEFRLRVRLIRSDLDSGKLDKKKADELYFRELDESIRRARSNFRI